MEVIETQRGHQKILLDGYIYTKRKEVNGGIVWRCSVRSGLNNCSANLKTDRNLQNPRLLGVHTHEANNNKVEVAKCRNQMKQRARTSLDKPNQILANANADLTELARPHLATPETIKRDLRRIRSIHRPREPPSLQELTIMGKYSSISL